MIKIDIKIGTDETVVIGECHIEVELSMDKIFKGRLQYDQNYRGDYRKGNVGGMRNYRGQNFRGGYRGNFRNNNLEKVEVGLEKDSTQVTIGEIIEVVEDQNQVQEQVPIEIELDALSVGSMMILPKTIQIYQIQKKDSQGRYSKCLM